MSFHLILKVPPVILKILEGEKTVLFSTYYEILKYFKSRAEVFAKNENYSRCNNRPTIFQILTCPFKANEEEKKYFIKCSGNSLAR